MKNKSVLIKLLMAYLISVFIIEVKAEQIWQDWSNNPIFDPLTRAYYPCVLYDQDQFFGNGDLAYYKMWFDSPLTMAKSQDGLIWQIIGECAGLTNARHSIVLYDVNCFGGVGYCYRVWYWDTDSLYTVHAIRAAFSNDGVNWFWDQPVEGNIITGISPDWNRGSYGPGAVIYNPDAPDTGSIPYDYSYVMFFDATTGGIEVTGLGFSPDGINWVLYDTLPVLDLGDSLAWDYHYAYTRSVIKDIDGAWHLWYNGGVNASNEGIGYAYSSDGLIWVKDPDNPVQSLGGYGPFGGLGAPGSWNEIRNYTPMVLYDIVNPKEFQMWRAGKDSLGNYTIGYAFIPDTTPPSPPQGLQATERYQEVELYWSANTEPDLIGYSVYRCQISGGPYEKIVTLLAPETTYIDTNVLVDTAYYYVCTAFDEVPNESNYSDETTGVPTFIKEMLTNNDVKYFSLSQNYPNPFYDKTNIDYQLSTENIVILKIYNSVGRLVKTLVNERKNGGFHTDYWDGRDERGKRVSQGVYFYRLQTPEFSQIKKMTLLR